MSSDIVCYPTREDNDGFNGGGGGQMAQFNVSQATMVAKLNPALPFQFNLTFKDQASKKTVLLLFPVTFGNTEFQLLYGCAHAG